MQHKILAQAFISFFLKNIENKEVCQEVYRLAELAAIDIQAGMDEETLGSWYMLVETILFNPEEYASGYPEPELDTLDYETLKKFVHK